MASHLYRLGRFAFRRRRLVAALWLGLGLLIVGAMGLSDPDDAEFSIPGTESQRARDLLSERFPEAGADGAVARVVLAPPDGQDLTDPDVAVAVTGVVDTLRSAPQVANVSDPFEAGTVNPAGKVAYAQVAYTASAEHLTDDARDALAAAAESGRTAGLTVEMNGGAVEDEADLTATEILGVVAAAVILVIMLGSLIAAGMPLLTALVGVGVSMAALTTATGFVNLSSGAPTLALMLGLAVAIDYALFIVSRYRFEVAAGNDPADAAGRAVGTAGSTVVFAGLTVIVVLSGLAVVNIPALTQMGLAAAFAVVIAVIIALTLLPALLGFAGRRVVSARMPGLRVRPPLSRGDRPTLGLRWARLVYRRPVAVLLVTMVGLGALAVPAFDLRLGLPDDGTAAPDSTQRKAYDLLSEGFGAGFNGPLTLVVDASGSADAQAAADRVGGAVADLDGVATVTPPTLNPAGDTALLTAVPASGPSSEATEELVTAIRDLAADVRVETGAELAVTGQTAIDIDMSDTIAQSLAPYLALVVGLAFLLLMVLFRSILVPVKATVGFLLTIGATFGALVAVFQWGWLNDLLGVAETGPIMSVVPIFLIGVVFGLAMDYQVFLVTRMREEYAGGAAPGEAVVTGFGHGARVVTAAALIMVSVFSGFVLSPNPMIMSVGFGLAMAVLFDAFVVRMAIVPAVMTLLDRWAWWLPQWLDRILPHINVEGSRIEHPGAAGPPHLGTQEEPLPVESAPSAQDAR